MKPLRCLSFIFFVVVLGPGKLGAQSSGPRLPFLDQLGGNSQHQYLRRGDRDYKDQDYAAAEIDYRKALEKRSNARGAYNLGNAIYQQERYDEAVRQYEEVANQASDNATKAAAYHNLGNAYFHQQDYQKSIEAYKNALRLQPQDMETKYNLALAQRQQQEQEKQEQQQQQQQQQQKKEDEQQQQQQQQQQQDQQQQQNPSENQSQADDRQAQAQTEPSDLSKEEARRLLEIMEREERKVQEKMRKAESRPTKSAKDW